MAIPVYLFTGFLDSGKSTFLQDTLRDPSFNDGENTLLLVCEEGEVEYDEAVLADYHTSIVRVENEEQLSFDYFNMLNHKYQPDRVMIEFNGTWSVTKFMDIEYPMEWLLVQIVTTVDASTFTMYMNNMRSFLYDQLVHSELIIFNRCDETTKKSFLRGNAKSINRNAQIIYETKDGVVNQLPEDDLPFDISSSSFSINDDDYGLWYMDILDKPQQYDGKVVSFKARIVEVDHEQKNRFLIGREAMVCCGDDIQTIGFIVYDDQSITYKGNTWVTLTAKIGCEYDEEYGGNVPILYTQTIKSCDKIEDYVTFN